MRLSFTRSSMRYLAVMTATVLLCLSLALALNAAVDPLWYLGGNRITPVNFAFNERLSKINLINGHEPDYDCVIFGDSRVTLLPETKIEGYRCFNFAFSAGAINEFVTYSQWLKAHGLKPRLVIVGVSAGDFRKRKPPHNVPEFVKDGGEPLPVVLKYLSLDVVGMSWRTLFGTTPIDRLYNRDFQCRVAVTSHYDPAKPIRDVHAGPFNERAPLENYEALRLIFPDARFIGYAPPISAWAIADYQSIDWLPSYTRALSDAAQVFDRFIDASVPSHITVDPANTYDGTHYSSTVNAEIASYLTGGDVAPSLNLKAMTAEEMLAVYRERLNRYADAIAARADAQPDAQDQAAGLPSQ